MIIKRLFFLLALLGAAGFPAFSHLAEASTVQFKQANYTTPENGGSVTLTVTAQRTGEPGEVITVHYSSTNGSAMAPDDYTSVSGTVTFQAGVIEQTITVPIINDNLIEGPESFTVALDNPQPSAHVTLGSPATTTITISDDDSQTSIIQFEKAAYSVNEADNSVTLTVTRSGGLGLVASVNYFTSDASANAGSDYTASSGTITFPSSATDSAGAVMQTITIPILNDSFLENSETFNVTLTAPSSNAAIGTPSTATVTILDNDGGSTIQFSPVTYTVNETAGQVALTVTLNRFGDPTTPISVDFATRNGTATAGQDYVATAGTITFFSGETQKTIPVTVTNDNLLENAENFFVDLTNPQGASLKSDGSSTATVTIADDDSGTSTIQFSSATYSVNESGGSVAVTVVRSGGVQLAVSASYNTANGTAQAGSDYTAASGTVSFAAGETQKDIVIPINDDAFVEGDETFTVTLSNPSAGATVGSPSSATVTIVDNDGGSTIQFSPTTYTVNEAAGQVVLTVIANRSGGPSTPITVDFATRNGTATAGQDYAAASGTISFGTGETQKQIAITITNDNLLENAENFFVDLSNPQGASLKSDGSATAIVTISDDDSGTSTMQFSSASYSVSEDAGSVVVTVVRSGGVQLAVSATYNTTNGSAQAGSDYTASSGTVTFASGETQKMIVIPINDDALVESDETFNVTLSNPSAGATLGDPSSAVVTILDNDGGGNSVRFSPTTYNANRDTREQHRYALGGCDAFWRPEHDDLCGLHDK